MSVARARTHRRGSGAIPPVRIRSAFRLLLPTPLIYIHLGIIFTCPFKAFEFILFFFFHWETVLWQPTTSESVIGGDAVSAQCSSDCIVYAIGSSTTRMPLLLFAPRSPFFHFSPFRFAFLSSDEQLDLATPLRFVSVSLSLFAATSKNLFKAAAHVVALHNWTTTPQGSNGWSRKKKPVAAVVLLCSVLLSAHN